MPDTAPPAATDRHVVGLLCRTAERGPEAAQGTRELAQLLGARLIGSPGEPGPFDWEQDLRRAHGCLLEAGHRTSHGEDRDGGATDACWSAPMTLSAGPAPVHRAF